MALIARAARLARPLFCTRAPVWACVPRPADGAFAWMRKAMRRNYATAHGGSPGAPPGMFAAYSLVKTAAYAVLATSSTTALFVALVNFTPLDKVFARWLSLYLTRRTGFELHFARIDTDWSWTSRASRIVFFDLDVVRSYETCERLGVSPNQTYFRCRIGRLDVELSALHLLRGKGLIKAMRVEHLRGTADMRHLIWHDDYVQPYYTTVVDRLVVVDCELALLQKHCEPMPLRLDALEMQPYRWQWQFLDVCLANELRGRCDFTSSTGGALLSVESVAASGRSLRERFGALEPMLRGEAPLDLSATSLSIGGEGAPLAVTLIGPPARRRLVRVQGMDVRRIAETASGPLSWMTSGSFDMSFTFDAPSVLLHGRADDMPRTGLRAHARLVLRDVHASIPLFDGSATFQETMYAQLARPLVAYINAHPSCVEVEFDFELSGEALDGAMGPWAAGFWAAVSQGVFDELARAVSQEHVGERLSRSWHIWGAEILRSALELFWHASSVSLTFD